LLNAVSGAVREIVRNRSNGPDRRGNGLTRQTSARHVHRRAIGVARFLAHILTPTPRSRERAAAHTVRHVAIAPAAPTTAILATPAPRSRASARRRLYRRHLVLRLTF
jgi:hypothetical protein